MFEILKNCHLCPRNCNINRFTSRGYCKAPAYPVIYSYFPHKGEEPPITGSNGSGIVFFSFCPLQCVYCQNFKFSHEGEGKKIDVEQLSFVFTELQSFGCHNINLVTGTQYIPWIREAIQISRRRGIKIPFIWNSSGFENPWIVEWLKNYIDIYIVDFRYASKESAEKYSDAPEYPLYAEETIKEMHRQKHKLEFTSEGLLKKGVIIRVLALPGHIPEFKDIIERIKAIVNTNEVGISILTQYTPFFKAENFEEINRPLSEEEIAEIYKIVQNEDFAYGWIQEGRGLDKFAGKNFKAKFKL